ncbi:MAG TPA: hypothetical protein VLR49_13260 [Ferruginibacter sp.]|nr:hypothetical protein [Ferruginibacter sp.]
MIPKGRYNGQKPIKLVSTNTAPTTNKIMPNVPVIVFVKYNTAMIAAITNLNILSAEPMFFFIVI